MKVLLLFAGIAFSTIVHGQTVKTIPPDDNFPYYRTICTITNDVPADSLADFYLFLLDTCNWHTGEKSVRFTQFVDGSWTISGSTSAMYRRNLRDNIGWQDYQWLIRINEKTVEVTLYDYRFRLNRLQRTFSPEEHFTRRWTKKLIKRMEHHAKGRSRVLARYMKQYRQGVRCY